MIYSKKYHLILIPFLLLSSTYMSMAYEPAEDETISKISDLSDAFIMGTIEEITYENLDGRPFTVHKVAVRDVFFDRIDVLSNADEINIYTEGGYLSTQSGQTVRVKSLIDPELVIGKTYIFYLRRIEFLNSFRTTTGESRDS